MRFFCLLLIFLSLKVSAAPRGPTGYPVCDSNQECPGFIAQLVRQEAAVCSSFLVQPNIMMTNRHCLPTTMHKAGSSCAGIEFHFPTTPQFTAERAECDSVLDTSESLPTPVRWIADMALVRLKKPVTRPPVEISTETIADNEVLQIFKVDPAPIGKMTPVIKRITCAKAAPISNMFFTSNPSPELTLMKCSIMQGNSGSPILNSKGKAVAIVWGNGGIAQPKDGTANFDLGIGTSFQCFKFAGSSSMQLSSACPTGLPPKMLAALEQDYTKGRTAPTAMVEQQSRLARKIDESFGLLGQKFKAEMEKTTGNELRGLFSWVAKEIPTKVSDKGYLWGRYFLVPHCAQMESVKVYMSQQGPEQHQLKVDIQIPVADLVRVTGEPDLYFTPLMQNKTFSIRADLSKQTDPKVFELSYQIETNPQHIELAVVKIPVCGT